jgi:hypothetical protein
MDSPTPLRAPLDAGPPKPRGFKPPRGIPHCTCHPCPPRRQNPLGGKFTGYCLGTRGYKSRPGKKIRKNEDFKSAIAKLKISTMNNLLIVLYTNSKHKVLLIQRSITLLIQSTHYSSHR